jgi:uncharacterized RDD family membrane protein YckC/Tfp pilus assembly major pilin PilA
MNPVLAGFWRRAAALFVDLLILAVPQTLVNLALAGSSSIALAINMVMGAAYFAGFHSSARQATPGKMAFGIKVGDMAGARISIGLAIARFFATWLSSLILGIGYLVAAFTAKKQALHDLLCKTIVINRAATPEEIAENSDTMPLTTGVILISVVWLVVPLIGIVAAVFIPVYQDRIVRAKVTDAIVKAEPFKQEVVEALASRRPIPAGKRRIDSQYVDSVAIEPSGQITITLSKERARGGQVFFAPLATKGGIVEWRCWSEGVSQAVLTAACRS